MIGQNPQRYSRAGETVTVSASPAVPPLVIRLGEGIQLLPLLAGEGVIVGVGETFLVGPETAAALERARRIDPHYWYGVNDVLTLKSGLQAVMGRTVPIILVDTTGLAESASGQEFALRQAGVARIRWPYEGEGPIPPEILRQINWTLAAGAPRPTDRWALADLGLAADYSYSTLGIRPPESGRINPDAIREIVERVGVRLNALREDFNRIGDTYFDGVLPGGEGPEQESSITELPPAGPDPDRQRVRKTTRVIDAVLPTDPVAAVGGDLQSGDPPAAPAAPAAEDGRRPRDTSVLTGGLFGILRRLFRR